MNAMCCIKMVFINLLLCLSSIFSLVSLFSFQPVIGFTTTQKTPSLWIPSQQRSTKDLAGSSNNNNQNGHQSEILLDRRRRRKQQEVILTSTANDALEVDASAINGLSSAVASSSPSSSAAAARKRNSSDGSSNNSSISKMSAFLSKLGMMAFIASMCASLPIVLFPPYLLHKLNLISKVKQQQMALTAGQFCARWLLRVFPFCNVKCYSDEKETDDPQPSVWVCNHTSALDIFILLAKDKKLRGKNKRPIKIVYWKGLEDNPITKLLFTQCGFIPVQMAANSAGEKNDYNLKSFKTLLKMSKQAFQEGFDIGILPEGQLNPHPEEKLLPCFPGAFTLARMSKRPIRFMALHGTNKLWHAREDIGMTVTGRDISVRVYPPPGGGGSRKFASADEFIATFENVVGKFATTGEDLDDEELHAWLDGTKWKDEMSKKNKKDKDNNNNKTSNEDDDKNK